MIGAIKRALGIRANRSSSYEHMWQKMLPSSGRVRVTQETALTYSAVWQAISIYANTIASLPLTVIERHDANTRRQADDHPLWSLLHDRVNPRHTAFTFWRTAIPHLLNFGNAYAEIVRPSAFAHPEELWLLPPDRVEVVRRGRMIGYKVRDDRGGEVLLPAPRVLHLRGLGFDGDVGYSVIDLARQSLELGLAAERSGRTFFQNNARPTGVLEHPGELDDDDFERLRESFDRMYAGEDNQGRTVILEDGLTFKPISVSHKDAEFIESRRFSITDVARWYNLPVHFLREMTHTSVRANIEEESINFVRYSLLPWIRNIEQELLLQVFKVTERRRFVPKFRMEGILRGDFRTRQEGLAVMRQNGVISANDWRAIEDLNPIDDDGGDAYLVNGNMIPSGLAGVQFGGATAQRSRNVEELRARPRIDETRQLDRRVERVKAHERLMVSAARRVVDKEVSAVRKAATRHLAKGDVSKFREWMVSFYDRLGDDIRDAFAPPMMTLADTVFDSLAEERGFDGEKPDNLEPFVREYVSAYSVRHVGSSRRQLEELLEQEDNAESAVKDRADKWDDTRPDDIGRQEIAQAGNALALSVYTAMGVALVRWVARGSETCPACREMNGRVVSTGQPFAQQGQQIQAGNQAPIKLLHNYAHPPLHDGCVCEIVGD